LGCQPETEIVRQTTDLDIAFFDSAYAKSADVSLIREERLKSVNLAYLHSLSLKMNVGNSEKQLKEKWDGQDGYRKGVYGNMR